MPARAGRAAPQPRHAGPLPAGLDVQDDHRRGRARRRRLHARTRPSTTRATAPSTARRSTTRSTRTGPRRSGSSTSSRPTSTRSTRSSATSARSSARARILDEAKKFGFYSVPPLETPAQRAGRVGPLPQRQACSTRRPRPATRGRPGPPRVRPGDDARDAAADGDGRRRRRQPRRRDEADTREAGDLARRLDRHQAASAGAPAGDEARDGRPAEGHDGQGGRERHRHERADPGRDRRRQDRHRRDRHAERLRRLVHLLRPGRQPDARRRRRRREPAERLRRRRRGADREARSCRRSFRPRRTSAST